MYPLNHPTTGQPVTIDTVCTDFVLAYMLDQAAEGGPELHPQLPNQAPVPPSPITKIFQYMPANFVHNQQLAPLDDVMNMVVSTTFDWASIMLYPSVVRGVTVMTRVGQQGQTALWTQNG